jgi:superfamily II DNA or RNA helicase
VQTKESFAEWVFQNWQTHRGSRTLAFCAGILQTRYLSDYFRRRGIASHALTASTSLAERRTVLQAFDAGDVPIIFSVDLFNEGLGVPKTDTILFIRPTNPTTVFLLANRARSQNRARQVLLHYHRLCRQLSQC